jgi:cytochrome c-type biogenesis protein CcmH
MLWLIFAFMIAVALCILLVPMLKAKEGGFSRAEHDIAVYRDQLSEVAAEKNRGLLGEDEAKAAELEIARRLLRADAEIGASAATRPKRPRVRWTVMALIAVVPLISLPLYLHFGDPKLADIPQGPKAPSGAELAARRRVVAMVDKLRAEMNKKPDNLQGWLLLGRSDIVLKRDQDAIVAFYHARQLAPKNANVITNLGEAEMIAADGEVTPRAATNFAEALALDPKQPGARYYLGLQKAQTGDLRGAFADWLAMVKEGPKDAPWMPMVKGQLQTAAAMLHVDLKKALAETPPTPNSGSGPEATAPAKPGPTTDPAVRR